LAGSLGPRALRVYEALHHAIRSGELPPGTQLPTIPVLASDFGVSPVTVRNVQTRLEEEGLISREVGRGTFVLAPAPKSVLIVEDDEQARALVGEYVSTVGYRALLASGPGEGLGYLEQDRTIVLVLSDIRMPEAADGIEFIRTVRRRWPNIPLAAVTGFPDDLAELHGTADCPTLVVLKPVRRSQIEETLSRLPAAASPSNQRLPVLIVDDDPQLRWMVKQLVAGQGHEVEEAATGSEALVALGRRQFSHVLLDLHMPGGGMETAAAISRAHKDTVVVLMTGYPEEVVSSPGGPWLLLTKPFHGNEVEQILSLRRLRVGRATA
jgi:CheY-like chemotaxis protein